MDLCQPDGGDDAKLIFTGNHIIQGAKGSLFYFDNFFYISVYLFPPSLI